ncbi:MULTISPECIES: hypothetical protein [Nonomuraea]|uniref:Uncharacterized protein n=1 Tax=Nonomuraea mangrovi TaxID=2316207 RepID=A0ABW4TF18_9ACTN
MILSERRAVDARVVLTDTSRDGSDDHILDRDQLLEEAGVHDGAVLRIETAPG